MKSKTFVYLIGLLILLTGCGMGDRINANSEKSLYRSVTTLQRRLQDKERVEFEVSFWSLKQYAENDDAFRAQVNGKTVYEVIDMGKENFNKQKASGNPEYQDFASWDTMIAQFVKERQQSGRKYDKRDRSNTIHNM